MRLNLLFGVCGLSLLATSAFAAGMGGGHGGGGGMGGGGHMSGGGMGGGGMHMGNAGGLHGGGGFGVRGSGPRAFHGGTFARRGYGVGGVYGAPYGYDYGDYGYNDPAYGYGENGDGLQSGRSAAEGGGFCQTPISSCQLSEPSYVGQPCSCETDDGISRGRVAR